MTPSPSQETMLSSCMRYRRHRVRYVIIAISLLGLTLIGHWLINSPDDKQSELAKLYYMQQSKERNEMQKGNQFLPRLNNMKPPEAKLSHTVHKPEVWKPKSKAADRQQMGNIRVEPEIREEENKVKDTNIFHNPQSDFDTLHRKVIGRQEVRLNPGSQDGKEFVFQKQSQQIFGRKNPSLMDEKNIEEKVKVIEHRAKIEQNTSNTKVLKHQVSTPKVIQSNLLKQEQPKQEETMMSNKKVAQMNATKKVAPDQKQFKLKEQPQWQQQQLFQLNQQQQLAKPGAQLSKRPNNPGELQQLISRLSQEIINNPSSPDVNLKLQQLDMLQKKLKSLTETQQKNASIPQLKQETSQRNAEPIVGNAVQKTLESLNMKIIPISSKTNRQAENKQPMMNKAPAMLSGRVKDPAQKPVALKDVYTVIHGQKASAASQDDPPSPRPLPEYVDPSLYVLEADSLPSEPRLRPSIANGHVATVIGSEHIHVAGLYNGLYNQSHRAEIPSTMRVSFVGTEPTSNCTRKYRLDVGSGVYSSVCSHEFYTVTLRQYAHRTLSAVLVTEVEVQLEAAYPLVLALGVTRWAPSYDLTFVQEEHDIPRASMKSAKLSAPERPGMPYDPVYILYDRVPGTVTPPAESSHTKWVYLTAIAATREEVVKAYTQASESVHSGDHLLRSHLSAWSALWRAAHVHIEGNPDVARAAHASMYALMSAVPSPGTEGFVGLSATELALGSFNYPQDYHGRVMPDQELWILPALLPYHPDLYTRVLSSRLRPAAIRGATRRAKAAKAEGGLSYPWQTAGAGEELTESPRRKSAYVSGLVSLAVLEYLRATNDSSVLYDARYANLLTGVATYYYKTLSSVNDGTEYGLKDVQPPDSYARSVDNSAFTNAVAALALRAPDWFYGRQGLPYGVDYKTYADDMYVPMDDTESLHLEHDRYTRGTKIQTADVTLLGYPLKWDMSKRVRWHDLNVYQKVMDSRSPPTSWAMHAIGWLEVDELDLANQAFARQFTFLKTDFRVWTEKGTASGACHYLSAAGAYLQSLTSGYLGLRYHDNHLRLRPALPPSVTHLHYTGVKYLGRAMEVWVWEEKLAVRVLQTPASPGLPLTMYCKDLKATWELTPGRSVTVARKEFWVFAGKELPTEGD